jgi:hypothetical protein
MVPHPGLPDEIFKKKASNPLKKSKKKQWL